MVIEASGKEQHVFAVGGCDDVARVRCNARATREYSEVGRFEMCEQRVIAFDRQDRFERVDLVAVVQRAHVELVPGFLPGLAVLPAAAQPQDRERFIDAAQHRAVTLEHLHPHALTAAVAFQNFARTIKVRVGIIAGAHLFDGKIEDARIQALSAQHGTFVRIRRILVLS